MHRLLLTVVGGALLAAAALPAQELLPTLDDREIEECRTNLSLIFEAIQAYRRVHQDVPNSLRELQPRFLADDRFFICPAARRLGMTSADTTKWGGSEQTTYGYEFSPIPIPAIVSGGSSRTMREWKRLQMGLLGSEVPIVRCHTHERAILNLAFGGRIYESESLDWEEGFRTVVDPRELWQARRLAAHTVAKKIVVPRRPPRASRDLIDLTAHYNLLLDEPGWPDPFAPRNPLAGLPGKSGPFHGTEFDVRGAIQLGALRPGLIHYPAAVTNILLECSARRVHVLVGAAGVEAPDSLVATCVFHMADGRQQRMPLHYDRHLAACLSNAPQSSGPSDSEIAWAAELPDGWTARLYHCRWTNAFPDESIRCMDFVGEKGNAGPFLVALSVDPER